MNKKVTTWRPARTLSVGYGVTPFTLLYGFRWNLIRLSMCREVEDPPLRYQLEF